MSKHKSPERRTLRVAGVMLEALALPFLIIVAVLLNLENANLGMIGLLLGVGACLFIVGLILFLISHLPQPKR